MKHKGFVLSLIFLAFLNACSRNMPIDRHSVVTRHNIINSSADSLNSLSLGNGRFAYTADITGLQTFPEKYSRGIPLGTMSEWGWHSDMNPDSYSLDDVKMEYPVHGRKVPYIHQFRKGEDERKVAASDWLRGNPHRIHLGFIGLALRKTDGSSAVIEDVSEPVQTLDLWSGVLESRFMFENEKVHVTTVCNPEEDQVAVRISSNLLKNKKIGLRIVFPGAIAAWSGYDMDSPEKHLSRIVADSAGITVIKRSQDEDSYFVGILKNNSEIRQTGMHEFVIEPGASDSLFTVSIRFSKSRLDTPLQDFKGTIEKSARHWEAFWSAGGAVDFSACTDPRAFELERRIILSRYLTMIQCSGDLPACETGLTYNSWFGKSHLEMHWWHAVHFALWQKQEVLMRQMEYYPAIYEKARSTASMQGYKGARWPKMVGPDGRESPSTVGTYLLWQQPHPVFYAELLYTNSSDRQAVLSKYKDIVFSTADFIASYAWYDSINDRYVLGPLLIPAQESLNKATTINPPFELAYCKWALATALEWKKRLGEEPVPEWKEVFDKISGLPVRNGVYLCSEDTHDSYTNERYLSDHPIVSGISGMLPRTSLVDEAILGRSLDSIAAKWNWKTTWGWDFPMLAMSAASIGRGDDALGFLLMDAPKNRYLLNGHNYQDARLSIYLPGNGGLLTAVAKMCVEDQFPKNGKWKVRWEDLNHYPSSR